MPDPRTLVVIKANGLNYTAFEAVNVTREYSDMISCFQLTCSEGGKLGGAGDARRLVPQTPVQVYLGGKLALTGAVTTRSAVYDARSHVVLIGGKSKTVQGPDSAIPLSPGNFNGYTAEQSIRGVLQPHGTSLKIINPSSTWSKSFPYLAVNPGERVHEFIEKVCKMRGAFAWDDAEGNLCIGQGDPSAAVVAELQEGRNILRATIKLDDQDVFAAISMIGQQPGQGDDYTDRTAQGTATNPDAKTTNIRVEHAPHTGDAPDMTTAANMESARSGWQFVNATVTVAGWFRPDGLLWGLTDNISIYSPMGFPNGTGKMTLGVQKVSYEQVKDDDGEGTTTTLTLVRPEFLTHTPNAGVQSDGSGGYGDAGSKPQAAQPVPPDYTQGSAGPGGLLGHV